MFFQKTAGRLLAGILAASAMITPALAATGTVNTGSSKLNLRSQAASTSSVLTKIPGGSTVDVLDTSLSGWYQVSFGGKTGYVASQYVDLAQESAPIPGRITNGPLNIRSTPSTSGAKCGKLAAGQQVDILETLNGWYRIAQGYVSADYVALLDTAPAAAAPQPVEAAAPAVEVSATEETDQTKYGRVITSSLNVRSGPSTGHDKCGKLYAGRTVEILETLPGWYRVAEGYVSSDYVAIVDPSSEVGNQVVDLAMQYLGYPYVYGGSSPKGFDCSGFTSYIYKQFGITLNRSASGQLDNGTPVAMSELQPGDLVLFKKAGTGSKRASHVGIYIGNHQFIHASTYNVGVIINDLDYAYYTTGFVGGRRLL